MAARRRRTAMRRNRGLLGFVVLAVVTAACAGDAAGPSRTTRPATAPPTTGTDSGSITESTQVSTTTTRADPSSPARPAILLDSELTLGYWMPMATNGTSVVYADFDSTLTTLTAEGTQRLPLGDIFAGESVTVSVVTRFLGAYWAFVSGDEQTQPGVASAAISADGLDWKRVEIGSNGSGARVPGRFATPDAVQFPGESGVHDASTDGSTLAVSGWTQTDAGAQPTVWTTSDGQSWTTNVLPNRADVAETAPRIAVSAAAQLVHTLGPYYLGPDLTWVTESAELDASLVGVDVADIAGGEARFVTMASNFGSGPYSFWEFEDGVWSVIDGPTWSGFAEADGRHPYLLADSPVGTLAIGASSVGLRSNGSWVEIAQLPGDPVAATVQDGSIVVVSMLADGVGLIPVAMPR